jgi:glycerol-3-phosphate O-acyltransferase
MLALAEANLRAEVETYDTYLRDEVYSVTITNPKDSNQEQCSGLFGIESIHEFVKECIGDAEYVEEWL